MTKTVYHLTTADKTAAAVAFAAAGLKARFKMLNHGFRVVFVGDWQEAARILNSLGFLFANGSEFNAASQFQDIAPAHGEVCVRFKASA